MPRFLEAALRHSAKKSGVKDVDKYVYGAMNNMEAMHSNKETAHGEEMQEKHEVDRKSAKKSKRKRKGEVFF